MKTIGIIGVGFLGECLAEGLASSGHKPILSPRSEVRTTRLSEKFDLKVTSCNSEVREQADIVILATRPADIVETAKSLSWRADQYVISVAAGIGLSLIEPAVSPAKAFRAMPIASSRLAQSPTAFYPDDPVVEGLFNLIGTAHPLGDERQFDTASIFGAFYALAYGFIGEAAGWAERKGLDQKTARELAARMVHSAASAIVDRSQVSPMKLFEELMTPGGITEEGLKVLEETGALSTWSDALDASHRRAAQLNSGSDVQS